MIGSGQPQSSQTGAASRQVHSPLAQAGSFNTHAREPDLIIGSWCGKKFRPERVATRAGFDRTPAVQHQDLYEIKSSLILQPGPAALTDGLADLVKIIQRWAAR